MGLILCMAADAASYLTIPELSVRVFSSEELCYCILKYPLLFLEDFLDDGVFRFLGTVTGDVRFKAELRDMKENGVKDEEIILRILEGSGYCSSAEAGQFRSRIQEYRRLSRAEQLLKKAELLFSLRRFGKAASLYQHILMLPVNEGLTENMKCRALAGEGGSYANLFLSEKAFRCYSEAWEIRKDPEIMKRIYFLGLTEPVIGIRERYLAAAENAMDGIPEDWDREYEEARQKAADGEGKKKIDRVFSGDPVMRARRAEEQLRTWKQDYRTML